MRSNINPMLFNKLFIRKHGMCLPSLSQIQERIDIIFDNKDSMELEKFQIKGVEWEDEHCKEVYELKSKAKKSKKRKKNHGNEEKVYIQGENGEQL